MNTVVKRILTVLVSLILLFYVGYQAYAVLYNPIRTMRVYSGTYEDLICTNAFVIHDEQVINKKADGVIDYVKEDGESVAKGGEVAAVYRTAEDAATQRKIQQLNGQIQQYKQMGSSAEAESIDIDAMSLEIQKSFLQLSKDADNSDIDNIRNDSSSFLSVLDKKQLATGEIKDFNSQINKLQKQVAALTNKAGAQTGTINAPEAGYFVSQTDGLENAFETKNVLSITAKQVGNLLSEKSTRSADAVGKVITGFASYIVCKVDENDIYKLHVGNTVSLRFLLSSEGEVPVTVVAISKDSSGCAVVLKCDYMTGALAVIRRQTVEIVADSYTGIKIPDSLIHIVNGEKGVFVRNGNLALFRKISEIYSAQGYVVSSVDTAKQDYVQVYDEIIENGDDLYDGKIIK